MASLQSNPLGEDMQEVMGVGGDYDREDYEVSEEKREGKIKQHLSCIQVGAGGPRRSHSHPGSRPNPPTSLSINPGWF